jgi:hypothetical protein
VVGRLTLGLPRPWDSVVGTPESPREPEQLAGSIKSALSKDGPRRRKANDDEGHLGTTKGLVDFGGRSAALAVLRAMGHQRKIGKGEYAVLAQFEPACA